MKKIFLIAIGACLIASASNAQNLKQSGNEKNLQVLFAPLGGSPISIDGISFRKFNATGTSAWRVNLFIGMSNSKDILTQADTGTFATGGGAPETAAKSKSTTFGIRPGYEKHFAGTERLSPYIGAEILFSMTTHSVDSEFAVPAGDVTTATSWTTLTTTSKGGSDASSTFGINLIAGADYYFTKSLSLGAELGFGWTTTSHPDMESERLELNSTSNVVEVKSNPKEKQGNSMQLGPNAVAQIKLGWLF